MKKYYQIDDLRKSPVLDWFEKQETKMREMAQRNSKPWSDKNNLIFKKNSCLFASSI